MGTSAVPGGRWTNSRLVPAVAATDQRHRDFDTGLPGQRTLLRRPRTWFRRAGEPRASWLPWTAYSMRRPGRPGRTTPPPNWSPTSRAPSCYPSSPLYRSATRSFEGPSSDGDMTGIHTEYPIASQKLRLTTYSSDLFVRPGGGPCPVLCLPGRAPAPALARPRAPNVTRVPPATRATTTPASGSARSPPGGGANALHRRRRSRTHAGRGRRETGPRRRRSARSHRPRRPAPPRPLRPGPARCRPCAADGRRAPAGHGPEAVGAARPPEDDRSAVDRAATMHVQRADGPGEHQRRVAAREQRERRQECRSCAGTPPEGISPRRRSRTPPATWARSRRAS